MGALISFLGGSAFRLIWGEFASYFTKRQDHKHELALMQIQADIAKAQHEQNLESIKVQAELGVKTIEVQRDADVARSEVDAWLQSVKDIGKSTGIVFLDIWNGAIRPLLATISIGVVVFEVARNGFVLSEWDRELVGAILGIYVADRTLSKRGK